MSHIRIGLAIFFVIIIVAGQTESDIIPEDTSPSSLESPGTEAVIPEGAPSSSLESPGTEAVIPENAPPSSLESPGTEAVIPKGAHISQEPPKTEVIVPEIGSPPSQRDEILLSPLPVAGEPRVTYSIPSGYAPAVGGPLTIKKTATVVEAGKGIANRLRVDVEITSVKKNRNDDAINDIDIYELVDESLNIVPPTDNIDEISVVDLPEELKELSNLETSDRFSDIPLINFKKSSSLEEIGCVRLALLRDKPMCSADPDSYKKVYVQESEDLIKYYPPSIINYNMFYWNKNWNSSNKIDVNENESNNNLENLSKYLKSNFGVAWLNPSYVNISYPICDYSRKKMINISDMNGSTEWILLQTDDADREEGVVLLNISGERTYYLKFSSNKTNKEVWDVSDWNGVMRFHVNSLSSKDRLFYWYYVRPKKSGAFNTESMIRINDEDYRGWPDIIYPSNIEVANPDYRFEINPILGDSKVFPDWRWLPWWKRLNLTYIIEYTGTASSTYLGNIEIKAKPVDGCNWYCDLKTNKNFTDKKTISLYGQIGYNNTGIYQIPAIWIEGTPYIFKDTVIVDDPVSRWLGKINSYYAIFAALAIVFLKKDLKDLISEAYKWLQLKFMAFCRKLKSIFIAKEAEFDSENLWQWSDSNPNSKWRS